MAAPQGNSGAYGGAFTSTLTAAQLSSRGTYSTKVTGVNFVIILTSPIRQFLQKLKRFFRVIHGGTTGL
jgi:hypothetical protein